MTSSRRLVSRRRPLVPRDGPVDRDEALRSRTRARCASAPSPRGRASTSRATDRSRRASRIARRGFSRRARSGRRRCWRRATGRACSSPTRYAASLAAKCGNALYPANDDAVRARIDEWLRSFDALDCVGPGWLYPVLGIGADRGIAFDAVKERDAKRTLRAFLGILQSHFGEGGVPFSYLVRAEISLADVVGAAQARSCRCRFRLFV